MHSKLLQKSMMALSAMSVSGLALADSWKDRSPYNMRPGVTEISQSVYDLHMSILWICTAIGVVVFSLMFYSMVKHRKSQGYQAAKFHESTSLEIAWTVVPFLIVIWMAYMATGTLVKMYDTSDSALTIKVTGSQWKWHYEYLSYEDKADLGVGFFSVLSTPREQYDQVNKAYSGPVDENLYLLEVDNQLVIPKDKKVRFLITSDDVIHAWAMPDFALKKDAIPGFINELWTVVPKTGTYYGQCSELCGKDHGFMPISVRVVEEDEFDQWLEEKMVAAASGPDLSGFASVEEAVEAGGAIYAGRCAMCHGGSGEGGMGGMVPAINGSAVVNGPIDAHISMVVNGSPKNPMMAAYRDQLSAKEIAAVLTYQRNALGNSTGDLIQPADIEAAK